MAAELRVLTAEPIGAGIVPLLEEMLERAKAGEFSSLGICAVSREGCTMQEWSRAPSLGLLIASAAALQYRLLGKMTGD